MGPADLTKRHLERLAAELLRTGRSRQSVKTYMSAINRFLAWCHEEEGLAKLRGPQPTVERRVLDVLSREEIQRLEDAAENERDKLLVRVLADTGIRVGELRRLQVNDVVSQGRERYLRVRGRATARHGGVKERLVPITPGLYTRLDRFVRRERPHCGTDRPFVTRLGVGLAIMNRSANRAFSTSSSSWAGRQAWTSECIPTFSDTPWRPTCCDARSTLSRFATSLVIAP